MYKIAILPHYYPPDLQGNERPTIWDEEYETLDEAIKQIEEWNSEVYYLSHNESGRPTYVVVESVDADYIGGGRNQDMGNYDWDNWKDWCIHSDQDDACGECSGCIEMMIKQDREYLLNNAVYKK